MNHYVGQEKLAPVDSWGNITFAKDWNSTARLQQAPIWHYLNTDQYRYDGLHSKYNAVPDNDMTKGHMADEIYKSVRMGHMPYYPQFNKNPLELAKESGAKSDEEIKEYVLKSLKDKSLEYAVGDVDAEENFPRIWYIWRGNSISGSMKGQEYALKHYLGTHNNTIATDQEPTEEISGTKRHQLEKMDLGSWTLNFRIGLHSGPIFLIIGLSQLGSMVLRKGRFSITTRILASFYSQAQLFQEGAWFPNPGIGGNGPKKPGTWGFLFSHRGFWDKRGLTQGEGLAKGFPHWPRKAWLNRNWVG